MSLAKFRLAVDSVVRITLGGWSMDTLGRFSLATVACAILSTAGLWAQTNQGSILGTVRDATGGVVPGAGVEVRNEGTNFIRKTLTNEQGFYLVDRIEPGMYSISTLQTGFKQYERSHVRLETNAQVRIDVVLEVGTADQRVLVEAS